MINRNILVPMVGDLFHYGHINLLEKTKNYEKDKYNNNVIVGLRTDEVCSEYKRVPIINYENRKIMLESCKYVCKVIKLSNTFIPEVILKEHNIDLVIHAHNLDEDEKYNELHFGDNKELYKKLVRFDYTNGISTSLIINKMKHLNYNNIYKNLGYFVIDNIYHETEIDVLIKSLKKLENTNKSYNHYEIINNQKCLKKIEGFLKNNLEIKKLIEKQNIINILSACIEDDIVLFKDKYNPKSKGASGFYIHIDGLFKFYNYNKKQDYLGWYSYANEFINLAVVLDDCTLDNGCLKIHPLIKNLTKEELYDKYNKKDNTIKLSDKASDYFKDKCKPIICKKGSIIVFNSLCVHYSEQNLSNKDRRLIYLTYNKKSEGDHYDEWLSDKLYCKEKTGNLHNREI